MQQDGVHAETIGHRAGVLAAGTAEGIQGVCRDIIAPLDGNFFDRVGHVLYSDAQKTFGDFLWGLQRRPCRFRDFLG